MKTKKKKLKRCYDGYQVPAPDALTLLQPYILKRRTESQVMIDLEIDLTPITAFIKEHKEDMPGLTLYHIIFAALVRAASTVPQINRFIAGSRVYQRRHVLISMMVKRKLALDGEETAIYPCFEPTDTLADIVNKVNAATEEAFAAMHAEAGNPFDKLTGILEKVPHPLLKMFLDLMLFLDSRGKLPKALVDMQPFHSSFYVTNVGSIGLPVIYHHLYEFGTCSGFLSMGAKETVCKLKPDGSVRTYRALPLKFVLDSRICDGFTYATACKVIKKCLANPEVLMESYHPDWLDEEV